MGYRFVRSDAGQGFLLPPDVRQWLPEDHLAWCVIDVVAQLDLGGFRAAYRADGQGRPAFDPAVMTGLLLYCYCCGVRSSRAVERASQTDVACRVITGNRVIDHATIARFRVRHQQPLKSLLAQSLVVCAQAGMVRVGLVALDGTKAEANAAKSSSRTASQLGKLIAAAEAEAEAMLAQAASADEAEDALWGKRRRGDELPAQLARRAGRLERLRAAKARLDGQQAARQAAQQAKITAYQQAIAERGGGRPPGRPPAATRKRAKNGGPDTEPCASTSDPDSRLMKAKHGGYLQGYNAQVIAGGGQIILAAGAFSDPADARLLHPMLARAQANLDAAAITDPIRVALADAGYASDANFTTPAGPIPLISTRKEARQTGRDPTPARIPAPWAKMTARLATPAGRRLYKRRTTMIEPVFAQIVNLGGRRILPRGLAAADTEIHLWATAHNLRKYHAAQRTRPATT